jgi:diaminopimelate epimerase
VRLAPEPDIDFEYVIHNADGGQVEQCGNGARCFARYVRDKGLSSSESVRVKTLAGVIEPRINADGRVTVDMGPPVFAPAAIPFDVAGLSPQPEGGWETWRLALDTHAESPILSLAVLSMGNPHAVQRVDDVDKAPVATQGPKIEHHPRFPSRVNAGFMQVLSRGEIRLRVWERGAGETLACGTGACAAVVAGIRMGWLDSQVDVHTRGGLLTIAWAGGESAVMMTGPAVTVFEGEIEVPDPP